MESHIEVKPSYGLAEDEITQMLQDSLTSAREDMVSRALREQQVEADRITEDLLAALNKDAKALLDKNEISCLHAAIEELNKLRKESTEHRILARQIDAVGKLSENFAAKRMNASIKKALKGKSLDQIENNQ
jgi:molecular chaperone HscA